MSTSFSFDVGLENLVTESGIKTTQKAVVRPDTQQVLGMVSNRYKLIKHGDLVDATRQVFKSIGIGEPTHEDIHVAGGGSRFYMRADFRNHTTDIPEIGDTVGMRITMRNSYDKSCGVLFQLGLLRLACLNGLVVPRQEFNASHPHFGGIDLKLIQGAVQMAVDSFENASKKFSSFGSYNISSRQGHEIMEALESREIVSKRIAKGALLCWEKPKYKEDEPRNLWTFFNSITDHLSHVVEGKHFETAAKINRKVSTALLKAVETKSPVKYLLSLRKDPNSKVALAS